MIVLHIAATLEGGAGIGLQRYHQALRNAGVDSRILILKSVVQNPEISTFTWKKRSLFFRIGQRLGLLRPQREILLNQIEALNRANGQAGYELFTIPFSDYRPEDHPWIKQADVVNIHWVANVLDWPRFFGVVRKPIVLTLHDQQPYLGGFHYAQDATVTPHLAKIEATITAVKKQALRGHRLGVVANSRWNAAEARKSGFFTAETPIETIYYPLDSEVFKPRSKDAEKIAAGIAPERRVIGFACENLNNKRKGFSDLVAALAQFPDSMRAQITLLSFGRDPSPELRATVNLPWIHLGFLDTDEMKVAAYAAMDVFVVPSRAEAFGLTALEAEAVGIPVVASQVGGLAEAIPPPSDPSITTLRAGILELLANDSLRQARAKAGRRLAVERHSSALIGPQLVSFFKKVIG